MNAEILTQTAIAGQTYNNSDAFQSENFRFKNCENLDKSDLFTLRNGGLIEKVDDPWNTTTWTWTETGEVAVTIVENSIISEASEEQLVAIERQAENLLRLPRNDSFMANEYSLLGEQLKTLSSSGMIEKVDSDGQLTVWSFSNFALRLLTSLESEQIRVSCDSNTTVVADD